MKLNTECRQLQAEYLAKNEKALDAARVAIYTMVGGGLLGKSAITQPSDFYIDTRVGKLPYPKRAICQAVAILSLAYQQAGIKEPAGDNMALTNLGVF